MLNSELDTTQDTLPGGQSPESGKGETSTGKPRTYTEADMKAETGRRKKVETQLTEMQSRLAELERNDDERELAGIKDKPDAQANFQLKKSIKELKAELAQSKMTIEELKEQASKGTRYEQLEAARKISAQYENIDPEDLIGKTEEQITAFCKKYGKVKGKEDEPPGRKPDSGVTGGGTGTLTNEQADNMSMEDYAARRKKEDPRFKRQGG